MPAASERTAIIAALDDVWTNLAELGGHLSEGEWKTMTELPRWTVQDNYSHIVGTELMMLGRPDPEVDLGDKLTFGNDIARLNEMSLELRRNRTGAEVLDEFRSVTDERRQALAANTDADFEAESFTPAGTDTFGRFMQIRVMDCWMHEQDVRAVLDRPGHIDGVATRVALDEICAITPYVVGKLAGAEDGQSVRLDLTGPDPRVIDVLVEGRAAMVDGLENPTVTVSLPALSWTRLAGGRRPFDESDPATTVVGDHDLGHRILSNAAFMI